MCCAKHTTRHNTIRHTLTFLLIYQLFAYNLGKIQLSLIEKKLLHYSLGKLQLTDDEKFWFGRTQIVIASSLPPRLHRSLTTAARRHNTMRI